MYVSWMGWLAEDDDDYRENSRDMENSRYRENSCCCLLLFPFLIPLRQGYQEREQQQATAAHLRLSQHLQREAVCE